MAPPEPCRGCSNDWKCSTRGLMNRLAIEAWVEDRDVAACPDYAAADYHGIEGVRA